MTKSEMGNTALALPDEQQFTNDIQAINRFQSIVHANMRQNHDYGIIPGTKKPTLLKPGAEKIVKLLGLSDLYDIVDRQEKWEDPFFRYLIKCRLVTVNTDITISEGLGECNSMESKYRWRWAFSSEIPEGVDKTRLQYRDITTKKGARTKLYRVENDDIYSQVNTILKMAKKRALVDAALSAGRLSEIFTQDIEDTRALEREDAPVVNNKPAKTAGPVPAAEAPPAESEPESKVLIDMDWLKESCQKLNLTAGELAGWITRTFNIKPASSLGGTIRNLTETQQKELGEEIESRLQLL